MKALILVVSMILISSFVACDLEETSDMKQRRQQEQLSKQGNQQVGMPGITNFQEKRMLKMILELRDTEIKTTTYIVDLNGQLHFLCNSIGYGVPYGVQYTNPMRVTRGNVTIPQADPNGLFSPPSADGTWVLCLNGETKKLSPVYIEPKVIVSPYALKSVK
jgi:hypothetical protein